jgi:hypothetical protein
MNILHDPIIPITTYMFGDIERRSLLMLKNEVKKEMQHGMDDPVNDLMDDRIMWTETPIIVLKISITWYWTM